MNIFQCARYVVDIPVFMFAAMFSDPKPIGSGQVINLGGRGCKIMSETVVSIGDLFAVRLYIPNLHPQIKIHETVVRWAMGQEFGLEFLSLQQGEQERLRQFFETLKLESQFPHP